MSDQDKTDTILALRERVSLALEDLGALATHLREAGDFHDDGSKLLFASSIEDAIAAANEVSDRMREIALKCEEVQG